jgi:hypothetical protein
MKARELQIGDLLYYKGKFNAFPFKVESITKKKVGYHAEPNEHRMYYLSLSDCEPILLTPEILEKNGFSDDYRLDDLSYAQCRGDVIGIHISGKNGCMDEMYFNYVHEVQHALRLCGINKNIEL